jgi:hypothetical protein
MSLAVLEHLILAIINIVYIRTDKNLKRASRFREGADNVIT